MGNRIRKTRIDIRRLSAAEAVVLITVEPEVVSSGSELRGKVTGPRCPGVTTVEIAYALQPLTQVRQDNALAARVVIPEPNLWTEATPFVYNARIELWEHGQQIDVANVAVGLKQAGC